MRTNVTRRTALTVACAIGCVWKRSPSIASSSRRVSDADQQRDRRRDERRDGERRQRFDADDVVERRCWRAGACMQLTASPADAAFLLGFDRDAERRAPALAQNLDAHGRADAAVGDQPDELRRIGDGRCRSPTG